jgi:hypothetical protein
LGQKSLASWVRAKLTCDLCPPQITLLKYFRNYMSEHLLKAGANITPRDGDELARLPYLSHWFRTKSAIVLHLTNGTVQINFFQVHSFPLAPSLSLLLLRLPVSPSYCDNIELSRLLLPSPPPPPPLPVSPSYCDNIEISLL